MTLVRWGERTYLVPESWGNRFCEDVTSHKSEPRVSSVGSYFLRLGDWDKAVFGDPAVPKSWSIGRTEKKRDRPMTAEKARRARSDLRFIPVRSQKAVTSILVRGYDT